MDPNRGWRHLNSVTKDEAVLRILVPDTDEESTVRRSPEVGDLSEETIADEAIVEHEVRLGFLSSWQAGWFTTDCRGADGSNS